MADYNIATKRIRDVVETIEYMCRDSLWLDEPDNPHYPPIQVKDSDLGAYHLPLLKELIGE